MSFVPDKEEIDDACARGDVATLRSMLEGAMEERQVLQAKQLEPNVHVLRSLLMGSDDAARQSMLPENSPIGFWVEAGSDRRVFVSVERILKWAQLEKEPGSRTLSPTLIVEAVMQMLFLPEEQTYTLVEMLMQHTGCRAVVNHLGSSPAYSLTLEFPYIPGRKKDSWGLK